MKIILSITLAALTAGNAAAATPEETDTTRVLDEVVVWNALQEPPFRCFRLT